MDELVDRPGKTTRERRWLDVAGLVLSLVVFFGTTISLLILAGEAGPYTGAAIDSYDSNILEPSDRAILNGIGSMMRWIWLVGTVLGTIALVMGIMTARSGRGGPATLMFACLTPLLALFISFWTIAAAGTPDYTEGSRHISVIVQKTL